jgi:hypothetical protein
LEVEAALCTASSGREGTARAGSQAQVTDEAALIGAYFHSGARAALALQYSSPALDVFGRNRYNLLAVVDLARSESVVLVGFAKYR